MSQNEKLEQTPGRMVTILTDIHFWVPLLMLLCGLLLLKSFH